MQWLAPCAWASDAPSEDAIQLRLTPVLAEKAPDRSRAAAFISGEHLSGRPGLETIIEGDASLRQPGLTARADSLRHDQSSDILTLTGDVRLNWRGDRFQARAAQVQLDAQEAVLQEPRYELLANDAHGEAERIDILDTDRAVVHEGTYTTCPRGGPDWLPDWILSSQQLELDQEEDEGTATAATLRFKDVPILHIPKISFPLTENRRSGWLPPTIGLDSKSGMELTQPYYFNIAPNRDATFEPTVMSRRGVNLGGEFRYLEDNYQGRLRGSFMPEDQLRHQNRWSLGVQHAGHYDSGLDAIGSFGLGWDINRVSDDDYWRDFRGRGLGMTDRLLPSDGALDWSRGDWYVALRAQKWQTLQDISSPIIPPYDRLPQLMAQFQRYNDHGFDYALTADYTRFHSDAFLQRQPNAARSLIKTRIAHPFLRSWGYLTPALRLHVTHYNFEHDTLYGQKSATRTVPTFSLDSGLIFERPTQLLSRQLTQTLEPRLKYIYTPYRSQNHLPNYDTGAFDFNFATIWADNAFAGEDRIADNHLVTAGLTSRFLDPDTGREALNLAVAQRYRFSAQDVVLPGQKRVDKGVSDIMFGAGVSWNPRWSASTILQYDPDTHRSTRTTINARYAPGPYRTFNAAWRSQRDIHSDSLDLAWQWPLSGLGNLLQGRSELGSGAGARSRAGGGCNGRWYSAGRLNYNFSDRKMVDAIVGLEYDAGCWTGRFVFEKLQSGYESSVKRFSFQLELIGLSRLGTGSQGVLRDHVPGYKSLHEGRPQPSRFMNYE